MTSTSGDIAPINQKPPSLEETHRTLISQCNYVFKALYLGALTFGCLLPQFDASAKLVSTTFPATAALRWDAFHFLHIATEGYVYEHEWAFLPGVSYLMRVARYAYIAISGRAPTAEDTLWPAIVAAVACDSSQLVYSLSMHHLKSPELALISALLSLIPTSPVTLLFAPYNEPFFTHLSLRGMLCCAKKEWIKAAFWFALACTFRSNGILLSGYIVWGLLAQPLLQGRWPGSRTLLKAAALTSIVVAPFVAYQVHAYSIFCRDDSRPTVPTWCAGFPPSIYSYVQSKYWDVGFLHYWTLSQLPNFIIAAPSLALIFSFAIHYLLSVPKKGLPDVAKVTDTGHSSSVSSNFQNASIMPFTIHAAALGSVVLFASHTQIILRLASSLPVVHWAGAWLIMEHPFWGRLWVFWSVIWGSASLLLWATFLPPA